MTDARFFLFPGEVLGTVSVVGVAFIASLPSLCHIALRSLKGSDAISILATLVCYCIYGPADEVAREASYDGYYWSLGMSSSKFFKFNSYFKEGERFKLRDSVFISFLVFSKVAED